MANEKRLIDADALEDACRKTLMVDVFSNWRNMYNEEKNIATKIGGAFKRIHDNAPTVDAVEVVRCKDCKHYVAPQGTYVCDCFEGLNFATDNDFCSYGERKDNG